MEPGIMERISNYIHCLLWYWDFNYSFKWLPIHVFRIIMRTNVQLITLERKEYHLVDTDDIRFPIWQMFK